MRGFAAALSSKNAFRSPAYMRTGWGVRCYNSLESDVKFHDFAPWIVTVVVPQLEKLDRQRYHDAKGRLKIKDIMDDFPAFHQRCDSHTCDKLSGNTVLLGYLEYIARRLRNESRGTDAWFQLFKPSASPLKVNKAATVIRTCLRPPSAEASSWEMFVRDAQEELAGRCSSPEISVKHGYLIVWNQRESPYRPVASPAPLLRYCWTTEAVKGVSVSSVVL